MKLRVKTHGLLNVLLSSILAELDLAGEGKRAMEEMQQIAEERGGRCLSDAYINCLKKLVWECAKGHQWAAIPNNIKRGSWCPYCAGRAKGTIEEMQQIAEERGGRCLSDAYINSLKKLVWECAKGHQWGAVPNNIKRGSWCPYCVSKAKGTIEGMKQIAEERGGKCMSDVYADNRTKLSWECAKRHQWETTPDVIKRGSWCPKCRRKQGKEDIVSGRHLTVSSRPHARSRLN